MFYSEYGNVTSLVTLGACAKDEMIVCCVIVLHTKLDRSRVLGIIASGKC